ncbi:50S ribosomal protein L17 [bacterium (Candidatus Gribaldobacteria) CG_4_10_14_0_8_um_filter_33_9]|uniref:Large ribosomal subunit protein bL17 n=1 Tax=bacterium (Candidatus Gribaldobacteria) CG_4_10_14_0_8_um_filter_33_9 TaxID=2014266 RepID=A0A2M7RN39_9BACT|nr:MAG: 50S ribosomal protein L17 [bacterium (Candidatus Gribaldobacteria) CG_4_10_14_0_8_um_filter_33_9]
MRKRKKGREFSMTSDQRKALIKSLSVAFFLKEKIKTTEAKAKELRGFVEKYITRAKKGDLASRRYLLRFLPENIVKKLMDKIALDYKERQGGYTRISKLGPRRTDGAKMAIIELVK